MAGRRKRGVKQQSHYHHHAAAASITTFEGFSSQCVGDQKRPTTYSLFKVLMNKGEIPLFNPSKVFLAVWLIKSSFVSFLPLQCVLWMMVTTATIIPIRWLVVGVARGIRATVRTTQRNACKHLGTILTNPPRHILGLKKRTCLATTSFASHVHSFIQSPAGKRVRLTAADWHVWHVGNPAANVGTKSEINYPATRPRRHPAPTSTL